MTNMQPSHKSPKPPSGCEGYLTRRQAARALGFASEFKIRQLERKGLLHSVRGPMRAAFYPRPEVLALKAQLTASDPEHVTQDTWTDAELLTLLGHPKPNGDRRTAYDLVLETQISIERALRVCDFWSTRAPGARTGEPLGQPPAAQGTGEVAVLGAPAAVSTAEAERRGAERLSRDTLLRSLRDPDPRVRQEAFAKLKESR